MVNLSSPSFSDLITPWLLPGIAFIIYGVYKRATKISISYIPGPPAESWSLGEHYAFYASMRALNTATLGNLRQFFQSQAGEAERLWLSQYGDIVRIKGSFGEDRLIVNDPKALRYIYNSGYNFDRQKIRREMTRLLTGRGLVWANGEVHRRQRKVSSPAFGSSEAKSYVPLFMKGANNLVEKWNALLGEDRETMEYDVPKDIARATLDVIGEVAFDYDFNALQDSNNLLARLYQTMIVDTFAPPTDGLIIMQSFLGYFPSWLIQGLFDYAPSKRFKISREVTKVSNDVSKKLVKNKEREALEGKGKRDVVSLLVRANHGMSKNGEAFLTDEELSAMMMTILIGGHETTATTLNWALYELGRQPSVQNRLRAEINVKWEEVINRGDAHFVAADLDSMPYTVAVVKEVLRLYPVLYNSARDSTKDQVLPLSKPIVSTNGDTITEVPIPKGLTILTTSVVYNRHKEIFGEDAEMFNPDRWLNPSLERKLGTVGVYGNMLTFGSGIRTCIGWRFAVYEFQSFLIELIHKFQFEHTPKLSGIRREPCTVMVPSFEGELHKGAQMPLRITKVSRD